MEQSAERLKQNWKGLQNADICFCVIMTILFLKRSLGTRLCLQPF